MKKRLSMLLTMGALALAVFAVPAPSLAGHCDVRNTVIFSYIGGQFALNPNAAVCIADPDDEIYDTRIINPGSTLISVRHTTDYGAGVPTLTAVIDGLGFEAQTITLTRRITATGSGVYDSDEFEIDPAASGAVTATVTLPVGSVAVCFHTLDAAC